MHHASWASSPHAASTMRANRSRDTTPELAVRRLIHARGLRYRVNCRPEPRIRRTADIVFTRQRIAVFIDGCYWHGCAEHFTIPATNTPYWAAKIERNRARDAETTALLEARGWTVLRFWEHETPDAVARRIVAAVNAARARQAAAIVQRADPALRRELTYPDCSCEPDDAANRR